MASAERQTTRSYAGRTVDLELLSHVEKMLPAQRVVPGMEGTPRIVSGIEKAVQRYAKTFLTTLGSVRLDKSIGNTLLRDIGLGRVQNKATLVHLYSLANVNALSVLRADDADPAYGPIPDDERIVSSRLLGISIDRSALDGGRIRVGIHLTTAAGGGFSFVIPVAAGITGGYG